MAALVASARQRGEALRAQDTEALRPAEPLPPVRRTRGPQKAPTKTPVSLRLDRDVVEALRRGGKGWQTRLNDMLREALGLDR